MKQKIVNRIGWVASFMAIVMFSSFIDQIRLNVSGRPGSVILPIAAALNGICWVAYGALKERTDWPIVVCNSLGFVLGTAAAITAVIVS